MPKMKCSVVHPSTYKSDYLSDKVEAGIMPWKADKSQISIIKSNLLGLNSVNFNYLIFN